MYNGRSWVRLLAFGCCLWLGGVAWGIEELREAEMTIEPEPEIGKAIYTFRFTPAKTMNYDRIVFECIYRQVFMVENSRGEKFEKVHEPDVYKYEEKGKPKVDEKGRPKGYEGVKFVDSLDKDINFRVPTSRERLVQAFGKDTFNDQAEIVIDRVRVTAYAGGKKVWQMEFRDGFIYRHDPAKNNEWVAVPK